MQTPFMAYENDTDRMDIADLMVTNGMEKIAIQGMLELTKDREGIKILTEKTNNLYLEKTLTAKNIRIEYPHGRTYGECILEEMISIRMINGEFHTTLHIKDKPKRLGRDEALKYYTNKLRTIWDSLKTWDCK